MVPADRRRQGCGRRDATPRPRRCDVGMEQGRWPGFCAGCSSAAAHRAGAAGTAASIRPARIFWCRCRT